MKELNEYIFAVFNLMRQFHYMGGFNDQLKPYRINKQDKKTINTIYNVYKLYRKNITKRVFIKMIKDLSLTNGKSVITNGVDIAEMLVKNNNITNEHKF